MFCWRTICPHLAFKTQKAEPVLYVVLIRGIVTRKLLFHHPGQPLEPICKQCSIRHGVIISTRDKWPWRAISNCVLHLRRGAPHLTADNKTDWAEGNDEKEDPHHLLKVCYSLDVLFSASLHQLHCLVVERHIWKKHVLHQLKWV